MDDLYSWSSFENDKGVTDSWRKFLKEAPEPEPKPDEAPADEEPVSDEEVAEVEGKLKKWNDAKKQLGIASDAAAAAIKNHLQMADDLSSIDGIRKCGMPGYCALLFRCKDTHPDKPKEDDAGQEEETSSAEAANEGIRDALGKAWGAVKKGADQARAGAKSGWQAGLEKSAQSCPDRRLMCKKLCAYVNARYNTKLGLMKVTQGWGISEEDWETGMQLAKMPKDLKAKLQSAIDKKESDSSLAAAAARQASSTDIATQLFNKMTPEQQEQAKKLHTYYHNKLQSDSIPGEKGYEEVMKLEDPYREYVLKTFIASEDFISSWDPEKGKEVYPKGEYGPSSQMINFIEKHKNESSMQKFEEGTAEADDLRRLAKRNLLKDIFIKDGKYDQDLIRKWEIKTGLNNLAGLLRQGISKENDEKRRRLVQKLESLVEMDFINIQTAQTISEFLKCFGNPKSKGCNLLARALYGTSSDVQAAFMRPLGGTISDLGSHWRKLWYKWEKQNKSVADTRADKDKLLAAMLYLGREEKIYLGGFEPPPKASGTALASEGQKLFLKNLIKEELLRVKNEEE